MPAAAAFVHRSASDTVGSKKTVANADCSPELAMTPPSRSLKLEVAPDTFRPRLVLVEKAVKADWADAIWREFNVTMPAWLAVARAVRTVAGRIEARAWGSVGRPVRYSA